MKKEGDVRSLPFICHPDFANEVPRAVFHKEMEPVDCTEKDPRFLNRHVLFRKKNKDPAFLTRDP